ncbi:hypothetical protein SAMN04488057_101408 [Cyclobacterium lianum]|uniref:Por secretion system C-terminal sorting domain-containing protein n=1 Tax=Cyclobacterium lianum TaxID=388280 RepID=A0A1M7IP64_9BACT|nr:hypothetical protein [Cyclobacterium lianum]SHM42378.1 hypothetical protein SAMN04488057_101408 [Cyclobacterium lianum]
MKNIMKISAIVALVLVSLTSMTPVPTSSLISSSDGKNLFFTLDSHARSSIIKITDQTANTLFYTTVYDDEYAKKFNLDQLAAGTYYFTVDNPQASVTYTFDVKGDKIAITQKEEKITPSVFKVMGDKVVLTLSDEELKKVDIKITNSNKQEIFSASEKVDGSFDKVFNFEKAVKDEYTITVKDGKKTYFQHFTVG